MGVRGCLWQGSLGPKPDSQHSVRRLGSVINKLYPNVAGQTRATNTHLYARTNLNGIVKSWQLLDGLFADPFLKVKLIFYILVFLHFCFVLLD